MESAFDTAFDALNPWNGAWAESAIAGIGAMAGYIAREQRPWYERESRMAQIDAEPGFLRVHDDNGRCMVAHAPPRRIYEIWYRDTDVIWWFSGWCTIYGSFEVDACDEDWIDMGGEA